MVKGARVTSEGITRDGHEQFVPTDTGEYAPEVLARIYRFNRRISGSIDGTGLSVEELPPNYILCMFCGGGPVFVFPENGATDKETPVLCGNCDSLFALGVL
jgi:hypothetical protein